MKKFLCIFLALTFIFSFAFGCNGEQSGETEKKITISANSFEYDIVSGDDYVITVNLDGSEFSSIRRKEGNGDIPVNSSNYFYDKSAGTITFLSYYLSELSLGEQTFIVITKDASKEFTVTIIQSQTASFDSDNSRTYVYKSGEDIVFNTNFGSASVAAIKKDGRIVSAENYVYANDKLTVKSEYLDYTYGKNDYSVELSNNLEFKFNITSTAVFLSDFDNVYCQGEWNFNFQTSEIISNGINGTNSLHVAGNGGATLLMGKSFFNVDFDTTKDYKLCISIKNLLSDQTPEQDKFFGFCMDNYARDHAFIYSFYNNIDTLHPEGNDNLSVITDENGIMHFEFVFRPYGETYIEGFFGYDPSNMSTKIFDVYLDDIAIFIAD